MATEWETTVVNPEWPESAANERRMLLALRRALLDLAAGFRPIATFLAGDFIVRAEGSPSIIGAKFRPRTGTASTPGSWTSRKPRPSASRTTMPDWKPRAGEASTPRSIPTLSDDTRNVWNVLVDNPERRDCRRVGELVRRKRAADAGRRCDPAAGHPIEAAILREWIRGNLIEGGEIYGLKFPPPRSRKM